MQFILRYKWIIVAIVAVAALFLLHQREIKRMREQYYTSGYEAASKEHKLALDNANEQNRLRERELTGTLVDLAGKVASSDSTRIERERVIEKQIAPIIAAQPKCSIDQRIIDGINSIREVEQ